MQGTVTRNPEMQHAVLMEQFKLYFSCFSQFLKDIKWITKVEKGEPILCSETTDIADQMFHKIFNSLRNSSLGNDWIYQQCGINTSFDVEKVA